LNITGCLNQLERVRKSGSGWIAQCPGPNHKHSDRRPSLSVTEGDDGRILLKCHAGCDTEQICAAKRWKLSDLFPENGNRRPAGSNKPQRDSSAPAVQFRLSDADVEGMRVSLARSPWCQQYIENRGISLTVAGDLRWGSKLWKFSESPDQQRALAVPHFVGGKLAGCKYRTIDGSKLFSQDFGSTIDGLYGVSVLDQKAAEISIYEGPEDIALAISHGFNATGIIAAGSKLGTSDVRLLSGYERIYLVGDQDIPGQKAIDAIAVQLPPEQLIRVRMPGYKDVGDLWKSNPAGFSENLKRILRFARASRVHFRLDDLLTESEICASGNTERYAVDQLLPLNDITMIFSEEKGGKSQLITYIGKCVANEVRVFGKYPTRKMPVVVLDLEASDADIAGYLSHFSRLGPGQIHYLTRKTAVPPLDSPALLRLCERERPLLVLESLTKFVATVSRDASMFDPAAVSRFFDMVLNLCAAGATVLITHHATRADAERYADSHQIGAAVARAYALVSHDRPRLERVRLEAKLFRGAEPISENLIAFPIIAERGEFGLAAVSGADPDVERVVEFVRSKGRAKRDQIKGKEGAGIKTSRAVEAIARALKAGLLIEDSERFLSVLNGGNADPLGNGFGNAFPSQGTVGNGDQENAKNLF
jgi:hypothetical protein